MARLPDVTDFGARPIPQARTPRTIDQSGEILGGAIDATARTVQNAASNFVEREDRFNYAQARSQWLQADLKVRQALDQDNNYSTYVQRYQDAMAKAGEAAGQSIRGRRDRLAFQQETQLDLARGVATVTQMARQKEGDVSRAGLETTLENNRVAALSAGNEADRTAFINASTEAIFGARDKGYISAESAARLRQAWTSQYAEGFVSMQSADKQLQMLSSPKGTVADYIDPVKRVEMIDTAQRRRLAEEDHAWALSQRAEKLMNDAASKDMDHALANGQLTPAWIEANRNRLSADDYRYAYKALEGESATDVNLYADLRERASGGQDVRTDARKALTDRRISRGDYDRLVSEVESERPGWYKRGAGYIQNSLKPSDVNPDPAAPQRFANALDDWGRWASENPKATEAQANDAYRRITSEYALMKLDMITLSGRMPRFLVGDRQAPDFDSTESATVRALQEGRIDRAEFERQAQLIKQWRDAHQAMQTTQRK